MKLNRLILTLGAGAVLTVLGGTAAVADPGGSPQQPPTTVVVSGHTLGAKDGLVVDYDSFAVTRGGGTVGATYQTTPPKGTVSPMTTWGASFAYSREQVQLGYQGYAKAAANVYSGKRIVEVCFWYTRGGAKVSPTVCSDANFNGGWVQGPEQTYYVADTLDPVAPHTIFNISTVRIDPSSHF